MLVFIDESGDRGLKFDRGSSLFFTCVAVVFADNFSADACDRTIDMLRRTLNKPAGFEFHFSHCSDAIRTAFLGAIINDTFRYAGFVVDKKRLYGDRFYRPEQFYEFAVRLVCEQVRPLLNNAKIIIDKSGNREFRLQLAKALKAHMTDVEGNTGVKKIAMEGSHSNNLLQLADMVCGAVSRSYTASDHRFRTIIKKREKFVQLWPQWK
jgi:hypothetical protein